MRVQDSLLPNYLEVGKQEDNFLFQSSAGRNKTSMKTRIKTDRIRYLTDGLNLIPHRSVRPDT